MAFGDSVKKGLTPFRKKSGGVVTGGRDAYRIANGYATALGKGDPVKVSNGVIQIAANSSAGVTGVFDGCEYIDPTTKLVVESNYWTASTSSGGLLEGDARAIGYVVAGTDTTFIANADGSVSSGLIGATFPVSVGTPDSTMKRSKAVVHASANASADQYMVRVLGHPYPSDNTVVEVELVSPGLTQG